MHPILFAIGPIKIYSYGVMLAIAFLVSLNLASTRCAFFNIKKDSFNTLVIILLVSGIVGARIVYVLTNLDFFIQYPLDVFMVNRGGLVFYGAFIFSPIFGIAYAKKSGISIPDAADLLAPFIALGHSIGRIGCFLNGCCFGRSTDSIFGVQFPFSLGKVYPTQIFSSAGLFCIFLALFFIQKRRRFKGEIIALYLVMYGVFRFIIEFLRGDFVPLFYGLSLSQVISIIFVGAGILLFCILKRYE
ncbi:prolipoprotein diacylglyceryl transferase [bacterium]|nr:MAG: prolipoprotein diacylglyceryl transferase [bacterium]